MELFVEHRVQGDVIFNLTEENLKEMGGWPNIPNACSVCLGSVNPPL